MINNTNLHNSIITIGNNNTINNQISEEAVDWEMLECEFLNLLHAMPMNSEASNTVRSAFKHTVAKDKGKLFDFIKSHASFFTSSLFHNSASTLLIHFINNLQ
ncbi:MAG: hypothetical protein K0Q48_1675 [Bacillota bacterium]|jgi:hypothetical protein|nr:hypothetical protein [Bacillota bacterium]